MRFVVSLFICLCLQQAFALFEDQIGEFDWLKENLGPVEKAISMPASPKYVYVMTSAHVVAKLNTKTGTTKWRRLLSEKETLNDIVLSKFGLVSISGNGQYIRSWEHGLGYLSWEFVFPTQSQVAQAIVLQSETKTPQLIVFAADRLVSLSLQTGTRVWEWVAPSPASSVQLLEDEKSSALHLLLGTIDSSDRTHYVITSSSGKLQSKTTTSSNPVMAVINEQVELIRISTDRQRLLIKEKELQVEDLKGDSIVAVKNTLQQNAETFLRLELKSKRVSICTISDDYSLQTLFNGPAEEVPAVVSSRHEGKAFVASIHPSSFATKAVETTSSEAIENSDSDSTKKLDADELRREHGKIRAIYPILFENNKAPDQPTYRMLCVMEDDALVMISKNQVLWQREEGLASLTQVEWVTPTDTEALETPKTGHLPTFFEALALQYNDLKYVVQHLSEYFSLAHVQREKSFFFGFSKFLIGLSRQGKLYGMDSQTGEMIWTRYLGSSAKYQIVITRDHPGLGNTGPEILLLVKDASDATVIKSIWINADNGETLHDGKYQDIQQVFLLPRYKHHLADEAESTPVSERVVGFVHSNSKISLYPDTKEARKELRLHAKEFRFRSFDDKTASYRGYRVLSKQTGDEEEFSITECWNVQFSPETKIAASSEFSPKEVVDSPVTITGDGSLLLKYLNPHLFSVATLEESVLHINLIDSVSGRIIHRLSHKHGSGPVHLVQSENWLIYSFWNYKSKRTEMGSIALYDGAINARGLNPWKRPTWVETSSSFTTKVPIVLQKSFIFPSTVRAMSSTITANGITPKHLLIALGTGQLYALNRRFVDPRRPDTEPTESQQKEGLVQYFQHVPVMTNPRGMMSYNQTLGHIKEITVTPASLESSTLAFAYGLDLFYMRIAPVNSFDLLPADFNYELLVLLVLGLSAGVLIMRTLVARKRLNDAWK